MVTHKAAQASESKKAWCITNTNWYTPCCLLLFFVYIPMWCWCFFIQINKNIKEEQNAKWWKWSQCTLKRRMVYEQHLIYASFFSFNCVNVHALQITKSDTHFTCNRRVICDVYLCSHWSCVYVECKRKKHNAIQMENGFLLHSPRNIDKTICGTEMKDGIIEVETNFLFQ